MNAQLEKVKEVTFSVLPIVLIVLFLSATLVPIPGVMLGRFLAGSVLIVIGLAIFLLGVDIGITPAGRHLGQAVARTGRLWFVLLATGVLGLLISIAEPDLHIFATQVDLVTDGLLRSMFLVVVVSLGIAVFLALGIGRIIKNVSLTVLFSVVYGVILLLGVFTSNDYLAISFDSSGATTGALTVPFVMALALGVSQLKKDSLSGEDDSFGLVGVASAGAIVAVMLMGVFFSPGDIPRGMTIETATASGFWAPFGQAFTQVSREVAMALSPIVVVFLVANWVALHLRGRELRVIITGLLYSFIGLIIFLVGVNAGFMEVGREIGHGLAGGYPAWVLVAFAFFLGVVTILAEPAVYVLMNQIQEVTSGYVRKSMVVVALASGVGIAVALSMTRILVPSLQLWHILLPGYVLAIILTYLVPSLFVGIAFDSGGVASGPMTATFVLAFAQGAAAVTPGADVVLDGFGVIALVAMTPLITLQILGLIFQYKSKKLGVNPGE